MKAPPNTSKPRALCPVGEQLSRLVQIVDLGSQRFKGEDPSRKIYFGFETCHARHTFKDENGPEPFMLQSEFAWYMTSANPAKKTKLRQFVESFFGKPFPSEDAAANFDFSTMIDRGVILVVNHAFKTDGTPKAQIVSVRPAGKVELPPRHNKAVVYEITNGEDTEFQKLPEFLQKKIRESEEFKHPSHSEPEPGHDPAPYNPADPNDDDIPF